MNAWERRLQYAANLLVSGTGVVYAAMRYLMKPADDWAVVNHPWQPFVQHLHVIVAPALVFACGVIWRSHVAEQWKRERRLRRSGPGLAIVFIPMIASGYLLQTAVEEGWRQTWIVVHVVASLIWLVVWVAHSRWATRRLLGRLFGSTRPRSLEMRRVRLDVGPEKFAKRS